MNTFFVQYLKNKAEKEKKLKIAQLNMAKKSHQVA
jgi:hypothetical protein